MENIKLKIKRLRDNYLKISGLSIEVYFYVLSSI